MQLSASWYSLDLVHLNGLRHKYIYNLQNYYLNRACSFFQTFPETGIQICTLNFQSFRCTPGERWFFNRASGEAGVAGSWQCWWFETMYKCIFYIDIYTYIFTYFLICTFLFIYMYIYICQCIQILVTCGVFLQDHVAGYDTLTCLVCAILSA